MIQNIEEEIDRQQSTNTGNIWDILRNCSEKEVIAIVISYLIKTCLDVILEMFCRILCNIKLDKLVSQSNFLDFFFCFMSVNTQYSMHSLPQL